MDLKKPHVHKVSMTQIGKRTILLVNDKITVNLPNKRTFLNQSVKNLKV